MQKNYIKGLVSIGVPTYNRPTSLKRALEIITSQTYKQLEIIVSDNDSDNPLVKEVAELFTKCDSRVKYFKQDNNIGVLANAEFVLNSSSGEYFTWFSDDDWRSPEFIENMVIQLENNDIYNMSFCDYHEVYENGNHAVGYPKTHINLFRAFESRFRLIRIIAYYWQKSILGKCNIFYSVFRKQALDKLDLKQITKGYKYLNMDNLIVFKMLQISPVIMSPDVMCKLTCGNLKYYENDFIIKGGRNIAKTYLLFIQHISDCILYFQNTNSVLEKFIIVMMFLPKFFNELGSLTFKKISNWYRFYFRNKLFHQSINETRENLNLASKLKLPNVTLIAVATRNVEENLKALLYSCQDIEFGCVKLLSHYTPFYNDNEINFVRIQKMKNIDEWSRFIVYDLNSYIDTDYILLVHSDGFVVNASSWRQEFLNYDYIGAPWPIPKDDFSYRDIYGNIVRVGNSVSLRSKKLLALPNKAKIPWEADHGYFNEDGFICVKNKHIFEANGMKFAQIDTAKYFAHESMIPEIINIKPFVFHKWAGSNSKYPKF